MASFAAVVAETSGRLLIRVSSDEDVEQALDVAKRYGARLVSLVPQKQSLEDLFTEKVVGGDAP
jgi:hypothetical protein